MSPDSLGIADQSIKELKQLSRDLRTLESIHTGSSPRKTWIEYDFKEDGTVFQFGLFKNTDVAVSRAFIAAETHFKFHSHEEQEEIIIVIEGLFIHKYLDEQDIEQIIEIKPGDVLTIPKGIKHTVDCPINTWVIALTIPADPAYPEGFIT